MKRWKAEQIAVTEASRAVHLAQIEADRQSGVVAGLELLLSADACELCRRVYNEARRVRLGQAFATIGTNPDYSTIHAPPIHPHCQCSMIEVLKPEYGGPADVQWAPTLDQPQKDLAKLKPPAKPKPADPLQAYRDWKPAKTYDEAVAWLKDKLGVQRVVEIERSDKHSAERWHTEKDRLEHANTVISEWNRMKLAYPKLPEAPVKTFNNANAKRGYAYMPHASDAGIMAVKGRPFDDQSWQKIREWEIREKRLWSTERQERQIEDNFRHELGHMLSTKDFVEGFVAAAAKVDAMKNLGWFRRNVSEYAGTNIDEAIAESFALYTRPDYPKGALPANLEAFFREQLGA